MADPKEIEQLTAQQYRSVDDVAERLGSLLQVFRQLRDRRSVFLTAYHRMTEALQAKFGEDFFEDDAWVRDYLIEFAELYRLAIYRDQVDSSKPIPECWQFALKRARRRRGLVLQDLLLGMNAHINRDLALALSRLGIETEQDPKQTDHERINRVIADILDEVQNEIADHYSATLGRLDRWFGRVDEHVATFGIEEARDEAWENAEKLTEADSEQTRARVERDVDRTATDLAEMIAGPPVVFWLISKVLDSGFGQPWWTELG